MAFSVINSGAVVGVDPYLVQIEINIDYQGLPGFFIVGLPAKEIEESKERVRSAIKNSIYKFPPHRITVNLAPADIPKSGSLYDLPIAIAILKASGQVPFDISNCLVFGELSLDGTVTRVTGAIPIGLFAREKFEYVCAPKENAEELSVIDKLEVKPIESLEDIVLFLCHKKDIESCQQVSLKYLIKNRKISEYNVEFEDIRGQFQAKRALEIAAAGGHHVSMVGPPGAGKTLLAKAMASLLPDFTEQEALEVTNLYSIAGLLDKKMPFVLNRPFRTTHHSTSKAGLIGGGNPISPGEISMAHHGVLFLDEFPELPRELIESLRQPMENYEITISRASGSITFPAHFLLVIASNPCPCGFNGIRGHECTCNKAQVKRYQEKLSGPIYDRVDLHISCGPVEMYRLGNVPPSPRYKTSLMREKVQDARKIQENRYQGHPHIFANSDLSVKEIQKFARLSNELHGYLQVMGHRLGFSARSYYKVIKIARTIADLEGASEINRDHIIEALQYRFKGF